MRIVEAIGAIWALGDLVRLGRDLVRRDLACQAPGTTGGLHTGLDDVGVLELREREATLGHRAELVGRMREDAARPELAGERILWAVVLAHLRLVLGDVLRHRRHDLVTAVHVVVAIGGEHLLLLNGLLIQGEDEQDHSGNSGSHAHRHLGGEGNGLRGGLHEVWLAIGDEDVRFVRKWRGIRSRVRVFRSRHGSRRMSDHICGVSCSVVAGDRRNEARGQHEKRDDLVAH